jgi:hypothetical protein
MSDKQYYSNPDPASGQGKEIPYQELLKTEELFMRSFIIHPRNPQHFENIDLKRFDGYNESEAAAYIRGLTEGEERGNIEATLGIAQVMLENGFEVAEVSENTAVPEHVLRRLFL